jgi:predicted aldo/keto reductase-like oxidoreductase
MNYAIFGDSKVKVSRLGFGCMRLPTVRDADGKESVDEDAAIEMLHKGIDLGVNYYDTAYFYHGGNSEKVLGKALQGGRRDKVVVSSKSPGHLVKKPGDYRRLLEEQLERLGTDHIDFYHFHGVSYDGFQEIDKAGGWSKEAAQAKAEGLIRHVSFSFHSQHPEDLAKLVDLGCFESVLCQYNVLDRSNEEGMAYAKSKGLGITVMGPLGGGRISGLPKELAAACGIQVTASAELGLRFVASNPNVDIILSGMSAMSQLLENAEIVSNLQPLSDAERIGILAMMEENKRLADLYCTGCNYCMPCPHEVNIPHILRMMNNYKVYGLKEYAMEGYAGIGKSPWVPGKNASACIECGECEEKCPQKLHIIDQLKESAAALG